MQTFKLPYELLARWDRSGRLGGVHVQHRYVTRDDTGTPIAEAVAAPVALTLDTAAGHPLGDLLSQLQVDALSAKAAAEAERDAALAARDAAEAARAAAEDDRAGMATARATALAALKKAQDEVVEIRKDLAAAQDTVAALQAALTRQADPAKQA
ncbi:hypothetical protein FBY14_104191 [Azospirillum brasilense]|nr:hypothetical protein FBY14_104191 [Azospirillum brasilense]